MLYKHWKLIPKGAKMIPELNPKSMIFNTCSCATQPTCCLNFRGQLATREFTCNAPRDPELHSDRRQHGHGACSRVTHTMAAM